MNESHLTLRELRILHETERALRQDDRLASLFREFGETGTDGPGTGPEAEAAPRPPHRLWLLIGVCMFLVPVLMVLHPGVGALVFFSAVAVGAASWANNRDRDRPEPG